MLNKSLLLIALLFCLTEINAQLQSKMKLGIETGLLDLSESGSLGVFLNVEPKLKSSKNTVIGLRLGFSLNSQTIENIDTLRFYIDDISDNGTISIVATFDYFWNVDDFRPYFGLGVGYYLLGNPIEVYRFDVANLSERQFDVNIDNQIGVLIRGGIEFPKWRLGLEYNYIPKASIKIPGGQTIGTVAISYLGLSAGFAIGNGRNFK